MEIRFGDFITILDVLFKNIVSLDFDYLNSILRTSITFNLQIFLVCVFSETSLSKIK